MPAKRIYKALRRVMIACAGGVLLGATCTADVSLPGGRVEVNSDRVLVDVFGLLVNVEPGTVRVDIPGIEVDVQH